MILTTTDYAQLAQFQQQLQQRQHRGLVIVWQPFTIALTIMQQWLAYQPQSSLLLTQSPCSIDCPSLNQITTAQLKHQLGTNQQQVFIHCQTMNLSPLSILAPTVMAGGLLWLLVDPTVLEQQPNLGQWFTHNLRYMGARAEITQSLSIPSFAPYSVLPNEPSWQLTSAQQHIIHQIQKLTQKKKPQILLVLAPRGYGKSTCLGIAMAQLLIQGMSVAVTASHRQQLASGYAEQPQQCFYAVDYLLAERPTLDCLFIDEAASIPLPLLASLLQYYPKVVMSTTVEGYEGSGRGFSLRLLPYLTEQKITYSFSQLPHPLRYAAGCELHSWLNKLLVLPMPVSHIIHPITAPFIRCYSAQQLVQQPQLLQRSLQLLNRAHYQTAPSDLQFWLDHPSVTFVVMQQQQQLLAVAVLIQEGKLDSELITAVHQGKRRLPGHLLPQAISFYLNEAKCITAQYTRVMRIAVSTQYQRQGLGQQLLTYCEQHTKSTFFGASFALTPSILSFWNKLGYQSIHLGQHRDQASNSYSMMVLKAQSSQHQAMIDRLAAQFIARFCFHLTRLYQSLDPIVIISILSTFPSHTIVPTEQVRHYAISHQDEVTQLPILVPWLIAQIPQENFQQLPLLHQAFLVQKVLQFKSWSDCLSLYSLSGKKAGQVLLKQLVQQLLSYE